MSDSTNTSAQQILLIRINNPFDPKDHIREEREWLEPAPLSRLAPLGQTEFVYSLNGGVVEPEHYATTIVSPGDCVVSCPILRGGGGGGKDVMRMVAMIVVAVASYYTGGAVGAAYGSMAGAAASAGVAIAGSLLVNSILPPVMPTANLGDIGATTESSYGADGPKNVSRDGGIVPVVYGRYRMGGNLISSRTEQVGADQFLYLLLAMSEGPVASIGDILINDTPLSKFNNAWAQTRLGHNNQAPIDWFANNEVLVPRGTKLQHDSWVYHTTGSEVDRLKINLISPSGIGIVDTTTGKTNAYSVDVEAQYRMIGTEGWRPLLSNVNFVIEQRQVVPHEVVEVTKKHVAYYKTRKISTGKNGNNERTVTYKLSVPEVTYTKSIVFKSFKYVDTNEVITDPEYIAQIRSLMKSDTTKKVTKRFNSDRGGKDHDDRERSSRSESDVGGLGSSDTDNTRGMDGGMVT